MRPSIARAIARIADDHRSSATALTPRAIAVLREARAIGAPALVEAACGVCRAQPAMGPIWNAAAAALAGEAALDRFARQSERAPDAVVRTARPLLESGAGHPLTLVTWSASGPVQRLVAALVRNGSLTVRCAEGRPSLEGRAQAAALSRVGAAVEVFADGALASAVRGTAAVVVGADALTAGWFVNKAGTRALALAAAAEGVPTYVLAGRDKALGPTLTHRVVLREGPAAEVWTRRPRGVIVRNPYFERVPWTEVAVLATDRGVVGAPDVAEVCRSAAETWRQDELARRLDEEASATH